MSSFIPVLAGLLDVLSSTVYIRSILNGKSKPHRTTRFVLGCITSLTFFSLLAAGNLSAIWLAGASMLTSIAIFGMSIKHGMGGRNWLDIVCLCIAFAGILLWQMTNNPIVALYSSILADLIGYIPAYVKTFKHPETEEWHYYAIDVAAGALVLTALPSYSLNTMIYPFYILVANLMMVVLSRRHPLQ